MSSLTPAAEGASATTTTAPITTIRVKYEFQGSLRCACLDVPPRLKQLRQKLAQSFPHSACFFEDDSFKFQLLYTDDKGATVTIATDDELMVAYRLAVQAGKVLRLAVPSCCDKAGDDGTSSAQRATSSLQTEEPRCSSAHAEQEGKHKEGGQPKLSSICRLFGGGGRGGAAAAAARDGSISTALPSLAPTSPSAASSSAAAAPPQHYGVTCDARAHGCVVGRKLLVAIAQVAQSHCPMKQRCCPLQQRVVTFLRDVTLPDGTVVAPGVPLVKTWRLRVPEGLPAGTAMVFVDGDAAQARLGAARRVPVRADGLPVLPGEVDVSVALRITPSAASEGSGSSLERHRGFWRLETNGKEFGPRVWVDVAVDAAAAAAAATAAAPGGSSSRRRRAQDDDAERQQQQQQQQSPADRP
jgi:hypothetical protein